MGARTQACKLVVVSQPAASEVGPVAPWRRRINPTALAVIEMADLFTSTKPAPGAVIDTET